MALDLAFRISMRGPVVVLLVVGSPYLALRLDGFCIKFIYQIGRLPTVSFYMLVEPPGNNYLGRFLVTH